jgi:hypothetical protein
MRKSLLLFVFFLMSALSAAVWAQSATSRTLPPNGKRAQLGDTLPLPLVQLGREQVRLAPGGIIFDQNNRLVVHGALPAYADVWYVLDMNGDVQRIYVLTPDELEQVKNIKR